MQTANCIVCGTAPTRITTGHLLHQRRMIVAGFCSDACLARSPVSHRGCFGEWAPAMGVTHSGKRATLTACDCGESCEVWRLDHPAENRIGGE